MFKDTILFEYAQKVIAWQGQEDRIFKLVLDNSFIKNTIINLNTEQQLGNESVDSTGTPLFNEFTNRTFYAESDPLGRGGQPYQVFQTGDYYDSFRVEIGQGFIQIDSNPNKPDGNLFEMYTENLEGLTDSSLQILIDLTQELYVKWIENNILPQ